MTERYVGTKIVVAWEQEKDGQAGYSVKYEDGYVSWSPKEVFEKSYIALGHEVEQLPDYAQRVVAEHAELNQRLKDLVKFLDHQNNGGYVTQVSDAQMGLLEEQQDLMTALENVLKRRIDLFYADLHKADEPVEEELGLIPTDDIEPTTQVEKPGNVEELISDAQLTNHGEVTTEDEDLQEDRRHTPIGPVVMIPLGEESTNVLDQAFKQLGGNSDLTSAVESVRFLEALSSDPKTTSVQIRAAIEKRDGRGRILSIQGVVGVYDFLVEINRERGDVYVVSTPELSGVTLKFEIELSNPDRRPQQ